MKENKIETSVSQKEKELEKECNIVAQAVWKQIQEKEVECNDDYMDKGQKEFEENGRLCNICGRPVESDEIWRGDYESINPTVVGDVPQLYGHMKCLRAVDRLVVLPNRMMCMSYDSFLEKNGVKNIRELGKKWVDQLPK